MLFLQACANIYSLVEFEVLEPATVSLPEDVNQLIVINRAPLTLDSFDPKDVAGLSQKQLFILDSLIVKSIMRGLLTVLRESPVERFQNPIWLEDRRQDTADLEDLVLTRREVEDICRTSGGDAIVSLESYSMDYEAYVYPFSDTYLTATKYYEISSKIRWKIYLPGSPRPFDSYNIVDTLFFSEIQNGKLIASYTNVQMLSETFYKSGRQYGRYLVPVWSRTSRTLYKGKEEGLKEASKQTDLGNWDQAYGIWKDLTESEDKTTVAKALYNMAIFNELEDKLDTASLLVDKALQYDSLEMISSYKEEIDTRILNRRELYKQVR